MSENLPTHVGPGTPATQDGLGGDPFETPFTLRDLDDEGGGLLKTLIPALRRFWWIFAIASLIGSAAAFMVFKQTPLGYMAEGNIWISTSSAQPGADGPIVQGGLFENTAWEELLTSFEVLDPVVSQLRLYLNYPAADSLVFKDFSLSDRYVPGSYRLLVGLDGRTYTLADDEERVWSGGAVGDSIGAELGFLWIPGEESLYPEREIEFSVVTPRDAARSLQTRLRTSMDRQGNFLHLQLEGQNPTRLANVLNGVMERHVAVAAILKRVQMDSLTAILQRQLTTVEDQLHASEQALESYMVQTITLPSEDTSPVVPGLEQTTNTVVGEYLGLRMTLDDVRRDRGRLEAALNQARVSGVQVEVFEMIPQVRASSPLMGALNQLTTERAALSALQETYFDEYGPVADLIARVETLETRTIPSLAGNLLTELLSRETDMGGLIESRAGELSRIPPRAIEEARRRRQLEIDNAFFIDLSGRARAANLAAASSVPDVQILDRAVVPQVPSGDLRFQFAAVAFLMPLGLALLLVMLLDRMDTRLRDPSQIGGELGLDWLATIPRYRPSSTGRDNAEEIREAFRDLRMKIDYAFGATRPLLLSITSPSEGEGKTFVSANLATAFADLGRKTILVDGDTRRGDLHHIIGRNRKPGLTDFLMNGSNHQVIQETDNPKLHFIGLGTRTTTSPELLTSAQMQSLLAGLKRRYEVIIVDSPPMAAGSDAYVLGAHTGSVLTVLRSGTTNRGLAAVQMESFLRLPVRLLGAVLNDFTPQVGQGHYRYYSHYLPGYEASEEEVVEAEKV